MITINSDEHPLMCRFHKPGAENRSVFILRPEQYDYWLGCSTTDEGAFLNLFPADEMAATPAPISAASSRASGWRNRLASIE
ncbi:MAG: hypothetical protein JWQ50_9524 [Caballeronia mineralivorans]|jgi:hypothetical protein|nr:hypothetical protein [Caballeronia mineralivorans]